MLLFSGMAIQLLLWQGADISVSIESDTEYGNGEVTISVLNTAGSTLLFYENAEMSGKIEYLGDEGWVEYCDVSYTADNASAVSSQYGGTFAELQPGESWKVSVPEDKISGMKGGTYRIKMTYITEKKYNSYVEDKFEDENFKPIHPPVGSDASSDFNGGDLRPISGINKNNNKVTQKDDFLAESLSEVYVETFEFTKPDGIVEEISFDESNIDNSDVTTRARIIRD